MNKKSAGIVSFFLVFKTMGLFIIGLTPLVIPFLGFFPYKDQLDKFRLPYWVSALANFDGIHYLLIAKNGYVQFEQAFFPLYPLLIRLLTPLFNNGLVAGLVISNACFLAGLIIIDKLYGSKKNYWLALFVFAFPTAFFFGAVYNEGLFLFLFSSTLYYLQKKNYLVVAVLAILASLTRFIGVFLVIPIFFNWWVNNKSKRALLAIVAPLIGLGAYCFYLWKTTGDPLYFLSSQPAFGANRSTEIILLPQVYWRYLKIFITANWDFRYFVSVIEFTIFNLVLGVLVLDLLKHINLKKGFKLKILNFDRLGLNLFSLANIILPTLTGTLSSIPRYSLMSISFFIYLTEIKDKSIKIILALIFLIFHIVLLAYFTQGYFVS
jgi:hypothetical protein